MRKFTLFIASLFLALGAKAQITDASLLSNDKCYHITSKDADRGAFYAPEGAEYLTHCGGTYGNYHNTNVAKDASSTEQQFAIIEKGGKLYLYSVSSKKFAKKDGNFIRLVDEPSDYVTVEKNGSYFNIKINGTYKLNFSGGYEYGVYANYNTDDDGNNLVITEAASFNPAEALSRIIENDKEFNWNTSTTWTELAIKDQTATVLTDGRLNGTDPSYPNYKPFIGYIEGKINIGGARTAETKFEYTSGNCALNIRGIEVLDADNNVVAGDYHLGSTGTSSTDNVYTVKVAEKGEYTVRCYAAFDGKNRHNETNGTITISFGRATATEFSKDVTFTAEYATLHLGYKVAIPAGVEAYVVSEIKNGYAIMQEVKSVIPAATPVILKKVDDENTYKFAYTDDAAATVGKNLLKGSIADRYVSEDAYVLTLKNEEVCFGGVKLNQLNETAFLNNANKAYLPASEVPTIVKSLSFRFEGEGTTGIEQITDNREQSTVIYDLTGRRIEAITAPGVYIVNGKKVLVK